MVKGQLSIKTKLAAGESNKEGTKVFVYMSEIFVVRGEAISLSY